MATIDDIIDATVRRVKASGMLTDNIIMGVVSAVGTNGTITVKRPGNAGGGAGAPVVPDDVYPNVRLLGVLNRPAVNDKVEICNTQGGWVCIGVLRTNNKPRIQTGTATTPAGTGSPPAWGLVTVTFPQAFAAAPTVVATPVSSVTSGSTEIEWAVSDITTTNFVLRCRRAAASSTVHNWIATDL